MALIKKLDLMKEVYKKLFIVRSTTDEVGVYFDDINACLEAYKNSLSKTNIALASLIDDPEDILNAKTVNVTRAMLDLHTLAEDAVTPGSSMAEAATQLEAAAEELNSVSRDMYQSESEGYTQLAETPRGEINPIHDALLNLTASISQYNTDVIINRGIGEYSRECLKMIDMIIADASYSQEDIDTVTKYCDELNELLDFYHFDEHAEFDAQAYLESLTQDLVDNYDNSEKAIETFTPEELDKFKTLLLALNQNKTTVPARIKQYEHLYLDTTIINTELPFLLTDESVDFSELLVELENPTGIPTTVKNAYNGIDAGEIDVINVFAGNEPNCIVEIQDVLQTLIAEQENLSPELQAKVNELTVPWSMIEFDDPEDTALVAAIKDGDMSTVAEYGTELAPVMQDMKDKVDNSGVNKELFAPLSTLDSNVTFVLAELANNPSMDSLQYALGSLMQAKLDGLIGDGELLDLLNKLPANIGSLNLNDLTNILGVNGSIADVLGRMNVLTSLDSLKGLIPASLSSLFSDLPANMQTLMNGLTNLTGLEDVFSTLSGLMNNPGAITQQLADMLSGALGGLSIDSIKDIFTSGNLMDIANISGVLSLVTAGLGNLLQVPFKMLDSLAALPQKIVGIMDNLGGLMDALDLDIVTDMMGNMAAGILGSIAGVAGGLLATAGNLIASLGLNTLLGGLFGPATLGEIVPEAWW